MDERTVTAMPNENPPILMVVTKKSMMAVRVFGRQSMGRPSSTSTPDIAIGSDIVSRSHGEFITDGQHTFFRDLGSTNGTLRNGVKMRPQETCQLSHGDVLRIHVADDKQCSNDVVMVFLTQYYPASSWTWVDLTADVREITVGRSTSEGLSSPELSRRHASFFLAQNGWAIIDHGSTNGVIVNGEPLTAPRYLMPMDVILMGGYTFLYDGARLLCPFKPGEQQQALGGGTLSISIEERSVWHRMKKKTLLKDIHLEIGAGEMVLVLGGSGAGKTTFLNAVMGYEPAQGKILYRGTDIYEEYEQMKYEIGYVPQQDLLRMTDTVEDTLRNAAQMRMPVSASSEQRDARVRDVVGRLGLERELGSYVGKLSGGQRKRLSIAVEYVGDPALFFLDEPDSGLDGTMARALMENLRGIADTGKIVILISHSPDRAYELFNRVIVLAKGSDDCGHLVFSGTPDEGCRFFDVDCLEKIVKRINRPDEGGDGLADQYISKFEQWSKQYHG